MNDIFLVVEALKEVVSEPYWYDVDCVDEGYRAALRLEEAEKQKTKLCTCGEPHVLMVVHRKDAPCFIYGTNAWVGLTDEEGIAIANWQLSGNHPLRAVIQAIEAKLKEKNGG